MTVCSQSSGRRESPSVTPALRAVHLWSAHSWRMVTPGLMMISYVSIILGLKKAPLTSQRCRTEAYCKAKPWLTRRHKACHQTVLRRGEKRWKAQITLNGSSWGLFARFIMCLISREGTQSLLLDRPLAPLWLRRCAVARLGAAPVCQSLHKQKPGFPLWNQPTSV